MYTTRQDAIEQAIIPAIEGTGEVSRDDYDLDAIFDEAFEYSTELSAYVQTVDTDGFWAIVQGAAR